MGNQTFGNYRTKGHSNILAYDKLPAELREAHRNCPYDFACPPDLKDWKAGVSAELLVEELVRADTNYVREDAKRIWGKQADDYVAAQPKRFYRDWYDKPARGRL